MGTIGRSSVDFRTMIPASRARGRLLCLATAVLLVMVLPAVAAAHAELETSSPADGATVPSPFDGPIVLGFSAALADGSKADLLGPDGGTIASATVDRPGAKMTFALGAALAPGAYEIKWTSVAEDTDVDRGTVRFTVAPAAPTASPSAPPTTAPTASAAAPTPSAEPASTASPAPPSAEPSGTVDASTSGGDVLLPIIVALIVVGAGAVYLLSRRNRPTSPG